jgi:hypothetical protein
VLGDCHPNIVPTGLVKSEQGMLEMIKVVVQENSNLNPEVVDKLVNNTKLRIESIVQSLEIQVHGIHTHIDKAVNILVGNSNDNTSQVMKQNEELA